MALDEFWRDIRRAAGQTGPSTISGPTGDRRVYFDLWLTNAVVDNYREDDFSFLPLEERAKLREAVTRFREVAGGVGPSAQAKPDQVEQGKHALSTIARLLDYDRYQDPESFRLGKMVEQRLRDRGWPSVIRELRFSTGGPFSDPPLFNVTAVLKEEELKTEEKFLEQARLVHQLLDPIAEGVAPDLFAHIMFTTDKPLTEYEEQQDDDEVAAVGRA